MHHFEGRTFVVDRLEQTDLNRGSHFVFLGISGAVASWLFSWVAHDAQPVEVVVQEVESVIQPLTEEVFSPVVSWFTGVFHSAAGRRHVGSPVVSRCLPFSSRAPSPTAHLFSVEVSLLS